MANTVTGKIIDKKFMTVNGERLADYCKIDFGKITPVVSWQFDHLQPIGAIKSIIEDAGSLTCEFQLIDTPVKKLNRMKRLVNKMFSLLGLKKPYSEPKSWTELLLDYCGFGVGGRVTGREGNLITGMDLMEISLIPKRNEV